MSEAPFLLSICIPTFQRPKLLEETLESIVKDPAFEKDDVAEIVVSDNFSCDETSEVCRKFVSRFPGKVRQVSLPFHQDGHVNFQNALECSRGLFRKLHNDNCPFLPGALSFMAEFAKRNMDKELLFFPNHPPEGEKEFPEEIQIEDISSLVSFLSFSITWIGASCIRKDAYERLEEPFRYSRLYFPHVDYVLRTMDRGGKGAGTGKKLFSPAPLIPNKYTHNHAEVFARNYLGILREYADKGRLSRKVFEKEKRRILFRHVIPYYFDFFRQYNATPQTRYFYYTRMYRKNLYYYFSFLYIAFFFVAVRVLRLNKLKNCLLSLFRKK